MNFVALIGSFVKNELVSRQLPDQAGIQLGIDRWNSSTHENTQTTSSRLSLEDSDGDENWLAAPSAPSPIHVVDDDATTSQPKNSTEPHPHNQIHPSSERMQKAHEVWGGYIAHLTNNLFLLVVLIARSYPVCWMVRLKLLESFLVAYVYSRIQEPWRPVMLEIDLLFNDVPGNRVSSMLTQVVTQDDLSMFMGLLFTFNRVVAANFPSGTQSPLSGLLLFELFRKLIGKVGFKRVVMHATLYGTLTEILGSLMLTHPSQPFTLQMWQDVKGKFLSVIPHHLHPLVYLLWNPSPASHPVVDRVVHKGLVECSVAVDMLSIKQAMHKMAHRTATRHASQVNAYLNPSVSAVPVTTSSASSGYAAAAAAAAAATAATTGAATAPELLPPKKRGRKNQPKSEEYGDAQENKGHVRFTAEHVLLSSFEEAVEFQQTVANKENLHTNFSNTKRGHKRKAPQPNNNSIVDISQDAVIAPSELDPQPEALCFSSDDESLSSLQVLTGRQADNM